MTAPRVAFYAPLKPVDHPIPSGDRQMARLILRALEATGPVEVASGLRVYDGAGDPAAQASLSAAAAAECDRLLALYAAEPTRRPALWLSYHVYYKAPDLIGPAVARALRIPYVVVEATRARKRLSGPWSAFAAAAESAIEQAALVLCVSARDRQAVEAYGPPGQQVAMLPPFLDLPPAVERTEPNSPPRLLTVAMMRPGDKLASYRLLAGSLSGLAARPWTLDIVGDGPAAAEISALFAPFGQRVRLLGACAPADLAAHYRAADLLAWPGLNEAFGMVYLEAQAHGVPVLAIDNAGTGTVIRDGVGGRLTGPTAQDFAAALSALLADPPALRGLGQRARAHVEAHHALPAAAERLRGLLTGLLS
ncbi:glycosyltransferase family 4 protein (plasmid) [Azospirillum oryzae]|uniref:Glycosyltransferase family 4 protein n=2 Tax=Azospirillum oryzae TaxID=286727 RepID=A0A6N1APL8_9PROT|nr:glycosyltransferase family 4 protein [Azospirillum oryzae]KAA0588734.1 glycosyltransferase family 4 protein [Azospirillum oryzae]QKS50082.1 glycosyltransferase family 4 protein [Azospirillum oryzae]